MKQLRKSKMAQKPIPSAEVLREILDYNPETGELTWKRRSAKHYTSTKTHTAEALAAQFNAHYAGKPALSTIDNVGYPSGRLFNSQVRAHRVIWKMVYGYDANIIDHKNRDTKDNRINNLRNVCKSYNSINRNPPAHNTTGVVGISWDSTRKKWRAAIVVKGRKKSKRFDEFNEAVAQRKAWQKECMA